MSKDDPVFISRDGEIWACWLNGKPAVGLGSEQGFWAAAEKLFNELHPAEKETDRDNPADTPADAEPHRPENPDPADGASPQEIVKRFEERHEVTIIGRVYSTGGSREVTIYDLSTHGCRIDDTALPKPGSFVSVKIGSVGPIQAVVRWQRGRHAGLKFDVPLYPSVLDHVRSQFSMR